jgi:hypothetical protein
VANVTPFVGPDRARQAILAKDPLEPGPRGHRLRGEQALTGEQRAGVLIGEGERKAVDPIARANPAFEVRGPKVIGGGRRRRDHPRMLMGPPPAALDQAPPGQEIRRGTGSGQPVTPGCRVARNAKQPARAPEGALAPQSAEELGDVRVDPLRTVVRRPTAIVQSAVSPPRTAPAIGNRPADSPRSGRRART